MFELEIIKDQIVDILKMIKDNPPDAAWIMSYGVYAGVNTNGILNTPNKITVLLHLLNKHTNTQIIVGAPYYKSCKDRYDKDLEQMVYESCPNCERQHEEWWERYYYHTEWWGQINWIVKPNVHAKYMVFQYGDDFISYISNRNLNTSNWHDICLKSKSGGISQALISDFDEVKNQEITMPVGKHKDKPLSKIKHDYLEWAFMNIFEMKHFIAPYLED